MINNNTFDIKVTFRVFVLFVLLSSGALFAQCPVVLNPNQIFCDSQFTTVANLQATNTG